MGQGTRIAMKLKRVERDESDQKDEPEPETEEGVKRLRWSSVCMCASANNGTQRKHYQQRRDVKATRGSPLDPPLDSLSRSIRLTPTLSVRASLCCRSAVHSLFC